jgi:hypothetical protein
MLSLFRKFLYSRVCREQRALIPCTMSFESILEFCNDRMRTACGPNGGGASDAGHRAIDANSNVTDPKEE